MESVFPTLPEFGLSQLDEVATPVVGARDGGLTHLLLKRLGQLVQVLTAGQDYRLRTDSRAHLTASGASMKILVALFGRRSGDGSRQSDLSLEKGPPEGKSGYGIVRQISPLFGIIVGVEDDAVFFQSFDEDDAIGRISTGTRGRQAGRIDLVPVHWVGFSSLLKPSDELFHGRFGDLVDIQLPGRVVLTHLIDGIVTWDVHFVIRPLVGVRRTVESPSRMIARG